MVREMGSVGIIDIATALGLDKGNVYRICAEMCARGALVKSGNGRGKVRYSLEGEEAGSEEIVTPEDTCGTLW